MSQSITKVLSKILTVIFAFSLVATSLPVNAAESKNSIDDLKKIQNNIREKDPQKIQSEKLTKKYKDVQVSNQKDLDIEIDSSLKQIHVNNKNKGNTTIGIPNGDQLTDVQTIDNQVIFSNKNAKFDVIAEAIDGGMRQIINIKDSSAPTTYDFPVSLEAGEKLIVNEDGSAKIESSKISEITKLPFNKTVIGKPWAKDANGKELKTSYSVVGSNLRQTIEIKDAVFPIIADPTWCGNTVYNEYWDYRGNEGGWTLSIVPTYCGRTGPSDFNEVVFKAPFDSNNQWYSPERTPGNTKWESLYRQYICHYYIATFKSQWNIEPFRKIYSWNDTYLGYQGNTGQYIPCNPNF